jgi:hypothetical protein
MNLDLATLIAIRRALRGVLATIERAISKLEQTQQNIKQTG